MSVTLSTETLKHWRNETSYVIAPENYIDYNLGEREWRTTETDRALFLGKGFSLRWVLSTTLTD
jgi:hypothetical protein